MRKSRYTRLYRELERHLARLRSVYRRLEETVGLPLSDVDVERLMGSEEGVMMLDQIAYRFTKLQDSMGRLMRDYLYLVGENVDNLPMLDVISVMERLGFEIDEKKWTELRELRNAIAHEYEDDAGRIAWVVNRIYRELPFFEAILGKMRL